MKKKVFMSFGNGNSVRGVELVQAIAQRLDEAREKHPVYAWGKYQTLEVIRGELLELEHAVKHETLERARDEALDVIATVIRFLNGEYYQDAK